MTAILLVLFCNTFLMSVSEKDVITLKEIYCIEDDGVNFFFKYPDPPVIDPDGNVFISDEKQILIFNKSGIFNKNIYKHGLGPAELNSPGKIFLFNDYLSVHNIYPGKILLFNRKTFEFIKQIRISDKIGYSDYLINYNNKLYFLKEVTPPIKKNRSVFVDRKVKLISFSLSKNEFIDEKLNFPKKYFISLGEKHSQVKNVNFVQVCPISESKILISNRGDYKILMLDLKKRSISRFIQNPDYQKVKIKESWGEYFHTFKFIEVGLEGEQRKTWRKQELDSIQKIMFNKNLIHIFTSEFCLKENKIRVDLYNTGGKFLKTVYMKMPRSVNLIRFNLLPFTIKNDFFYIFNETDDGNIRLYKYRINYPE